MAIVEPRDFAELAGEVYVDLGKLRSVLSDSDVDQPVLDELDALTSELHLVAAGHVVAPGSAAVTSAPHASQTTPPSGRYLVDLVHDAAGKTEDLASGLHQLGAPVASLAGLLQGSKFLSNVADALGSSEAGLLAVDRAADQAAHDLVTPPAGTRPGERVNALDRAGQELQRFLAANNPGRLPAHKPTPAERVTQNLQDQANEGNRRQRAALDNVNSTAKSKTKQPFRGPKPYQPKGTYQPKNWRRGA